MIEVGRGAGVDKGEAAVGRDLNDQEIAEFKACIAAAQPWIAETCPHIEVGRVLIKNAHAHQNISSWHDLVSPVTQDPSLWAEAHKINARSLVRLFLDDEAFWQQVTHSGIAIGGLWIDGDLDLYNVTLGIPLRFLGCHINGRVVLRHGKTATIDFRGSTLGQVDARRVHVRGDALMSAMVVRKGVLMDRAEIEGRVDLTRSALFKQCSDCVLLEDVAKPEEGPSLAARFDQAEIGQDLIIDQAEIEGALLLDNAQIGANLIIQNHTTVKARVSFKKKGVPKTEQDIGFVGHAIRAHGLKVRGEITCSDLTVEGQVRLLSVETGGSIEFDRVTVEGASSRSILLDFSKINGDLRFRGLHAIGCLRMRKVAVTGDVVFAPALTGCLETGNRETWLSGPKEAKQSDAAAVVFDRIKGFAVRMAGSRIEGDLRILGTSSVNRVHIDGTVDASNVIIGRKLRVGYACISLVSGSTALYAPFLNVGADARFEGVEFKGAVELEDAKVNGNLAFVSTDDMAFKLNGQEKEALKMRRIQVGGNLVFSASEKKSVPFKIRGPVYLSSAAIVGEILLNCGSILGGDGGLAFGARAATIGRGVRIQGGFWAIGEVRLIESRINDDILVFRARLCAASSKVSRSQWAFRLDRAVIDGSVLLGADDRDMAALLGPHKEPSVPSDDASVLDDPFTTRQAQAELVLYGGLNLTGTRIDGNLTIHSAHIVCLSLLASDSHWPTPQDPENTQTQRPVLDWAEDTPCRAVEARLATISKDLNFGSRPVLVGGQVDFGGSKVAGSVSFRNANVFSSKLPQGFQENAVICSRMDVGLDFDFSSCVVLGGVNMTQVNVQGTCHINDSMFASPEIVAGTVSPRGASDYSVTDVDHGEVAIRALRATFGRSLKFRETVQVYGVVDTRAATIGNDLEFWLRSLLPPQDVFNDICKENSFKAFVSFLDRYQIVAPQPATTRRMSAFAGQRAQVAGTFFLGFPADLSGSEPERDEDKGGYLSFVDMHVSTLRDSKLSWPQSSFLDLTGFVYDRIDQYPRENNGNSVPLDGRARIEWIRLSENPRPSHPEARSDWLGQRLWRAFDPRRRDTISPNLLYDQLSLAFRRMGLPRQAETVDVAKQNRRLWRPLMPVGRSLLSLRKWRVEGPRAKNSDLAQGLNTAGFRISPILDALLYVLVLPARVIAWFIYGLVLRYGYQPWRVIPILALWYGLGIALTGLAIEHGPDPQAYTRVAGQDYTIKGSCIIPSNESYYNNFLVRTRRHQARDDDESPKGKDEDGRCHVLIGDLPEGYYPTIPEYPRINRFLFSLDSIVPLDLGMTRYWMMSSTAACRIDTRPPDPQLCGLRAQADLSTIRRVDPTKEEAERSWITWLLPGWTYRDLHTLFIAFGYVLFGIAAAAATGLIRPNVKSPD